LHGILALCILTKARSNEDQDVLSNFGFTWPGSLCFSTGIDLQSGEREFEYKRAKQLEMDGGPRRFKDNFISEK